MELFLVFASFLFLSTQENWSQFRGPNSSGVYDGAQTPTDLTPGRNELWNIELPPGHSSPVIHGSRIFLTGFLKEQKLLLVICLDRETGKQNWKYEIPVDHFERGHPSFNPASSTPATDGENVVAYFGSYGLVCLDKDGKKKWEVKLPVTKSYAGNATSPIIHKGKVILYRGNLVDHFVVAYDKDSGKELWKVNQEEPFHIELACTACPIVIENQLILHSARSVQSLDYKTGTQNWVVKCATTATSTPVVYKGRVIVAAWNKMGEPALRPKFPAYEELLEKHDQNKDGSIAKNEYPVLWIFHRPEGIEAPENGATLRFQRADANKDGELSEEEWNIQLANMEKFRAGYKTHGLLAIPHQKRGLIDNDQVTTLVKNGIPEVPSPIVKNGMLYTVKNGGLLTCINLESGKQVYRKRISGKGTYYASPVIANDYLYAFAGNGEYSVIRLGTKGEKIAEGSIGENVYATPAIQDGVIYVRTHNRLYAFANN